jgi:hypothetical protein
LLAAADAATADSSAADWQASAAAGTDTVKVKVPAGSGSSLRRLLNQSKETMIAEEKGLLKKVVELLEEVAPQVCVGAVKSYAGMLVQGCDRATLPETAASQLCA